MLGRITVSYTHLDVYKRQHLGRAQWLLDDKHSAGTVDWSLRLEGKPSMRFCSTAYNSAFYVLAALGRIYEWDDKRTIHSALLLRAVGVHDVMIFNVLLWDVYKKQFQFSCIRQFLASTCGGQRNESSLSAFQFIWERYLMACNDDLHIASWCSTCDFHVKCLMNVSPKNFISVLYCTWACL